VASGEVFAAIEMGDVEALRRLVEADPSSASVRDEDDISAVLSARYRDRLDMLAILLAAGPQLDVFEGSAVGDAGRVEELIRGHPELVGAWSRDGYTPLHLASFFGHADVVALLLERGAGVSPVSRNPMEVMPIHSAAAAGHAQVVAVLLDHGAQVDARSHLGFTAIIDAAQNGDVALVAMLIDRGADPQGANDRGQTPLDVARDKGHQEVVDLLESQLR
jgi:ankyrin repeat protein